MRCARHRLTETNLSCGRCGRGICPRCLVHADVGIRCQSCAPRNRRRVTSILGWLVLLPLWRAIFKARALYSLFATGTTLIWMVLVLATVTGQLDIGSRWSPLRTRSDPVPSGNPPGTTSMPVVTDSPQPSPASLFDLALLAAACTGNQTFRMTTCEGTVRNLSPWTIEGVQVVVEWVDDQGAVQATDSQPIDYNPLLAGQESPWKLIGSYNPALSKYRVSFGVAGSPLRTRDDRP